MEESISQPLPTGPLEDDTEASGSKPIPAKPVEAALEESSSTPISRKLYEQAVDDAQYLMAYASSKCPKYIKRGTIEKLINARSRVYNKQPVDAKEEADFWLAYQDLWKLVSPVTAECIRASEDPATRKIINRHIALTVTVLILLLFFQIYWVIGNQLTIKLAELQQQETELNDDIAANQEEYRAIERRFRESAMNPEGFTGNNDYLYTVEFERDTADNLSERAMLETKLASLTSQRGSNTTILWTWSKPWQWMINSTLTEQEGELKAQIKRNENRIAQINNEKLEPSKVQILHGDIADLERDLGKLNANLETDQVKISEINSKLGNLYRQEFDFEQLDQELQILKDQNISLDQQIVDQANQEKSRQTYLAAQFILIILQSYLLPLLYGLLGASTSALRSLSREMELVIFSNKRRIQHLLRISLGALAGIMVGWFSFLLPSESTSFVGSVSPLAIAFLVGYNIEVFFSLMDVALNSIKRMARKEGQTDSPQDSATAA